MVLGMQVWAVSLAAVVATQSLKNLYFFVSLRAAFFAARQSLLKSLFVSGGFSPRFFGASVPDFLGLQSQ